MLYHLVQNSQPVAGDRSPLTQSVSTFLWFLTFFLCSFCLSRNSSIPFSSSFSITASWIWEFPTLSISKANQNSYSVSGKVFKDKVTFFRRYFCDVAALWVVTSRAALKKVSLCFCMHWHYWGLKSRVSVSSWPHLPQLPPSFGTEAQGFGAEGGKELWPPSPLCVLCPGCAAGLSLDEGACWEFPRISQDGLNFRAPGWCWLKWLGAALHLSALVPLKWNPAFSRNPELPYPGPTNTSVRQLLFKREFWCKQQLPVTRYWSYWLPWGCFLCVSKGFIEPWGTFRKLVWWQWFAEEGTEFISCDLTQIKFIWRTSYFLCNQTE